VVRSSATPPSPERSSEQVSPAVGYSVAIKGAEPKPFSCPECETGLCDCIYAARAYAQKQVRTRGVKVASILSPAGVELAKVEKTQ
jgi:hypothetical protein